MESPAPSDDDILSVLRQILEQLQEESGKAETQRQKLEVFTQGSKSKLETLRKELAELHSKIRGSRMTFARLKAIWFVLVLFFLIAIWLRLAP